MSKCQRCDATLWVVSCDAGLGKACVHKEMPEGCTPTDARVLRKANHDLADELSRREWQGLTPGDFERLEQRFGNKVANDFVLADIAATVATILREKNG